MKICMIVPHFLPHIGGGEQLYFDIAQGIKKRGNEVRIITSSSGGIFGHVPYNGLDVYYYEWKMFSGHPIVKRRDLKKHIQWTDIVHTTMFTTALPARQLARKYGKPCIITVHEVLGNKWFWIEKSKIKAALFDMYERFICIHKFEAVHVVSESTKKDYLKFCGDRNDVIRVYNSVCMPCMEEIKRADINLKKFFGLNEGEKCILYYGRPAPNKGIFVLEDAIRILKEKKAIPHNVKFCFILAKDPAVYREKFLARAKKYNLDQYIKVKLSVKKMELLKLITEADFVVIPSITEGFGFCAVEACSLEKKVIYSDGGSLPEVVFGKCVSFSNRDSDNLADKIEKVLTDEKGIFENIPEKKFDKDGMIDGILKIYEKISKNSDY